MYETQFETVDQWILLKCLVDMSFIFGILVTVVLISIKTLFPLSEESFEGRRN